jgi:cytochrome c biogenesis protein CcdA/thiol-disulfide isomerase/thioredoxin
MLQILLALVAGVLTIAAPCILLPLPIILGGSVGQKSKTRPLFITLGFVVSFAAVALLVNYLVQKLGLDPNTLRTIAVILLAIFAFFMIWPTPFEKLMTHMNGFINRAGKTGQAAGSGNFGGFILGAIIGIVWAPCAGPILGSILTLIALQKDTAHASLLLISYAIGAGIPMLGIAYGGQALTTRVKGIAKYSHRLQQIFGIVLLLLAAAIFFQYDTVIQAKLVEKFPGIGSAFEKNLAGSFTDNKQATPETNNAPVTNNSTPTMEKIAFKNYGPAPEFAGISKWLNSDPLTMQSLRGKVVLVDFWTYTCINCVRTLPYVTKWYDTYKDKGLVVIGVHTPEFAFEKEAGNVSKAIQQHSIHYPVAQDNAYGTWNAFNNQFWPAEYLIDQNGNIVYTHFGEGEYDHTENAIRQLIGLDGGVAADNGANLSGIGSPEMYFGTNRLQYLSSTQSPQSGISYKLPATLALNTFALEGAWKFDPDKATLTKGPGKIQLKFHSGKVFMVASSDKPITITTIVDGKPAKTITVQGSQLYNLFDSKDYTDHLLEIKIPDAGFQAFTFTFG